VTETERTLAITQQSGTSGQILVCVDGELDHHNAHQLRAALTEIPFAPGVHAVVDLTGLEYCDSTGITVLITAYHRATAAGSTLSIAGLNPGLERVFRIAGIDQVIPLHATTEHALRSSG
jgi:anti-sigma B factor antagonist